MARDLPANISDEIARESLTPYELFIIVLDGDTLYFTNHDKVLNFYDLSGVAQEYLPLAIKREDIHYDVETLISHVTLSLDNINRAMGAYIAEQEFRGRRIVIRKVFEGFMSSSSDYVTIFDGLIDKPSITTSSMELECVSRAGTLSLQTPRRMYTVMCGWKFGSGECNFDIDGTAVGGVADFGTTTIRLVDAARNEATDFWKHGEIVVTSGTSLGQTRRVVISSGANISVDFAFASGLQTGDHYTIKRGCSKTHLWCSGLGNLANFGGFPTIPEALVIR